MTHAPFAMLDNHLPRRPLQGTPAPLIRRVPMGNVLLVLTLAFTLLASLIPGSFGTISSSPASAAEKPKPKPSAKSNAKSTSKSAAKSKQKPQIASLSQNRQKQEKVRRQKIAAASKLKKLQGDNKQIEQTLSALNDDLANQNAALGSAKRALVDAEQEVTQALADADETSKAIGSLSGARQAAALDSYVDPPIKRLNAILNSKDLGVASGSQVYLEVGNRGQADALDQLLALEEDNALAVARAKKAEAKRNARKKAAASRLANLKTAQDRAEKYASLVSDRQDEAQYELESLATIDATLAKQISRQQREYEIQLAKARRNGVKGSGGAGARLPDIPTGSTNGIVVAASIRPKLAAMLAAAARDGVYLSGGGYRSSAGQIAVRRRNCGSSSYAIYQAPSSSCHPPTAKPGRSQHERGLAIDFTQNGRALRRSSSGYQWLRGHAAAYGFYNLPSEAWHWSTTGR